MFNFQVFAANILAAVANAVQTNFTIKVKTFLEETLADKELRLTEIAKAVLDKEIDIADIPDYAKVELYIAESDLIAVGILTATEAEAFINAIVDKAVEILSSLAPKSA